jgi:choline-sulfatase
MRRKIKYLVFLMLSCCVIGVLVYMGLTPAGKPGSFQRLPFRSVQEAESLHFEKSLHRWSGRSKRGIAYVSNIVHGTGILFRGRGLLSLKPGISGKKGFSFNIDARRSGRSGMSLKIRIKRGQRIVFQKKIAKRKRRKIRYHYSHIRKFSGDDEVVIEAIGEGAIVVSDAFVYDILDKPERKFVFVIGLDTERWDKIGRVVNGVELTPHLNRFKHDSVTFEHAFAQSSWTLPSFTSFFTGLYEYNHRINRYHVLDAKIPFLIETFSKSFMTASINGGVWLSGKIGNSRGFDFYQYGSRTRDVFASRALFLNSRRFIRQHPVPGLFLFMHTYALHAPYNPPLKFLLRLNKNPLFREHGTYTLSNQYRKNISPKVRRTMGELYEAEIMAFDFYFGKFIDFLKEYGIYDQSLIVFFSDHGEEFYEHRGWSHGHSLYNELIRVPLIIKFPANQFRTTRVGNPVGIIDILPTLLDYLQIEQKNKIDGLSLMNLVATGSRSGKEIFVAGKKDKGNKRKFLVTSLTTCPFFDHIPKKVAILWDHYKLIYNFPFHKSDRTSFQQAGCPPEVPRLQIFDIKNDPLEKKNLYPDRGDLAVLFRKELDEIIKKVNFILRQGKTGKADFSEEDINNLKTLGYL